ncbi:hypothetical protein R6Q57_016048 [Mikania cordata]
MMVIWLKNGLLMKKLSHGQLMEWLMILEVLMKYCAIKLSDTISVGPSVSRELYNEDFESEDEEEVDEEDEYELHGVEIIEHYGHDDDEF